MGKEQGRLLQGDRLFIPCLDVDRWREGDRIPSPWGVDPCRTSLLVLDIDDAITLSR